MGLTFNSTAPIEYIQIDARNLNITSANYQKFDNGGTGFEAGTDYTILLDLEQMGGNTHLTTYPIKLQEIRFVPNKTTATAGEQSIAIKALYAHYKHQVLMGDINADGEVNVSDVTALVNRILGDTTYPDTICDINGDGEVNVTDVTTLVNRLLK